MNWPVLLLLIWHYGNKNPECNIDTCQMQNLHRLDAALKTFGQKVSCFLNDSIKAFQPGFPFASIPGRNQ
jgi:hypothetical protein